PRFPALLVSVNVWPALAIANEFSFVKEIAPSDMLVSRETVVKAEPTPSTAASPGAPGTAGFPLQSAALDQLPFPSWIQVLPPTATVKVATPLPGSKVTVATVPAAMPAPVKVGVAANAPVRPPNIST